MRRNDVVSQRARWRSIATPARRKMRLNQPSAAATAREPHAARTPRERQKWCLHGARETCGLRAAVATN
eukprot:9799295-Lingulodinium_polyedra.AAC.1